MLFDDDNSDNGNAPRISTEDDEIIFRLFWLNEVWGNNHLSTLWLFDYRWKEANVPSNVQRNVRLKYFLYFVIFWTVLLQDYGYNNMLNIETVVSKEKHLAILDSPRFDPILLLYRLQYDDVRE